MNIDESNLRTWEVEIERTNGYRTKIWILANSRLEVRSKLRTNLTIARIFKITEVK